MGCRRWSISGGEPMLRPDFAEIFDRLTRRSLPYSLNTNGTLITPEIARLLKRKGAKMIALCGATADVHDHITRTLGSFDAVMRGFAYLREAGTGFIVQLVPLRDNYHEFDAMIKLALSLSPVYRIGAPWLYLSDDRDAARNREIIRQRLDPTDVVRLDPPDAMDDETPLTLPTGQDNRLFAACIEGCRDFHIDPYGGMTFCCFIRDPKLRYNLRDGNFREAWDEFIPSLARKAKGNNDYWNNCGRCEKRTDCRWCPAYAYLEQGRYAAKIPYLCALADETRTYRENWRRRHRRYFRLADVTIRVDSDLPLTEETFDPKFKKFEADGPSEDMISIRHHFSLPDFDWSEPGEEIYNRLPWAIYRKDGLWIYLGISGKSKRCDREFHLAAIFNEGHTRGRIYHGSEAVFRKGNLHSLTMFPSDQILLARALADREACIFHAAGVVIDGKGLLLVGHSAAGKTTAAEMLKRRGEVLCDDRVIVRRRGEEWRIYGTWSHGDLADISPGSAPLSAILFLKKAETNRVIPVKGSIETARILVQHVVKSLVTADWWEKILALIEHTARDVPAWRLEFDMSGRMVDVVRKIITK